MVTKTITVTEDAYHAIKDMKSKEESFSELFLRISNETCKIHDLFGKFKSTPKELDEKRKRLMRVREELSDDLERREHVFTR